MQAQAIGGKGSVFLLRQQTAHRPLKTLSRSYKERFLCLAGIGVEDVMGIRNTSSAQKMPLKS